MVKRRECEKGRRSEGVFKRKRNEGERKRGIGKLGIRRKKRRKGNKRRRKRGSEKIIT